MNFPEEFFEEEIRSGFKVDKMMKRVWAAEMEVLQEIINICNRHGIVYYAYSGTLLGAVRHQGFIPWDDDIDLAMKREDYNKFLKFAQRELPKEYIIRSMYTEKEYDDFFALVGNSTYVSIDKNRLSKYHGCPFAVGVDIFPLDYIPKNQDDAFVQKELLNIITQTISVYITDGVEEKEKENLLCNVEECLNRKFDHTKPILQQLLKLFDGVSSAYEEEESEYLTLARFGLTMDKPGYIYKKEWFDEVVELPFEITNIVCPKEYDKILKSQYGDYRKEVRNTQIHDYPFYKNQIPVLQELLNNLEEEEKYK